MRYRLVLTQHASNVTGTARSDGYGTDGDPIFAAVTITGNGMTCPAAAIRPHVLATPAT